MKKIIGVLLLVGMLAAVLTGCGPKLPSPEITEGSFDVSVTYEVNGETKTLDLVYLCEYEGTESTIEGTRYRAWHGHFEGYEEGEVIEICKAADGSRIVLNFLIYAEYFMGEPEYAGDFDPRVLAERIYFEDDVEMISSDQELIAADYGVRILGVDYDTPIKNTFA